MIDEIKSDEFINPGNNASLNIDDLNRCKIVGTLGPSSNNPDTIRQLISSGLNIFRLNFSHGSHEIHGQSIENIRNASIELKKPVAILQDLQGPKIRVGKLRGEQMKISSGANYRLEYGTDQTGTDIIPIDYRGLVNDVRVGDRVLMDDGLLILKVNSIKNDYVEVTVEVGGTLKNRKGVNFPDSFLSVPSLTDKDYKDVMYGIEKGVDFIALSFVQSPEDVLKLKNIVSAEGHDIPIIAKIEKLPAMQKIAEICSVSDGLMVARGDLGVEANVERVPNFQRIIVNTASRDGKPVIIATQMLESMIQNSRASLAETADVANGVLDGADCLMLSGEVASGKYPVQSVQTMYKIIKQVENWSMKEKWKPPRHVNKKIEPIIWEEHESIAISACEIASRVNAKAIVCLTLTGSIARSLSKWRPRFPIIAISPAKEVVNRLSMIWGVVGIQNPSFYNTDVMLLNLPGLIKKLGIVRSGDTIVLTGGTPINQMRSTNMIKIDRIP